MFSPYKECFEIVNIFTHLNVLFAFIVSIRICSISGESFDCIDEIHRRFFKEFSQKMQSHFPIRKIFSKLD
eukprot:UN22020